MPAASVPPHTRTIIPFPASPAPIRHAAPSPAAAPTLRPVPNPRREYSFAEVTRLLSLHGGTRTRIDYLRDLARQCAMPLPRNPRRFRGRLQSGAAMIGSKSRWCALEFDAWMDAQRTPPPGGAATSAAGVGSLLAEEGAGGGNPPALPPAPVPAGMHAAMRQRARRIAGGC